MTDRDMVAAVLHDDWHHCPYHPTRVDECRKYRDALRMARLLAWFAAEAEAEGHNPLCHGDRCPKCGAFLDRPDRPCPMGCKR